MATNWGMDETNRKNTKIKYFKSYQLNMNDFHHNLKAEITTYTFQIKETK